MAVVNVTIERCTVRPWQIARMRREGWVSLGFTTAGLWWAVQEFGLSRGPCLWWWCLWNVPCVRVANVSRHMVH